MAVSTVEVRQATADGAQSLSLRVRHGVKRAMDILASILALGILLPVFLVISLLIAVVDGRPIFFRQARVGRFGRHFTMYKFRSMVRDAESLLGELEPANQRTGPLFKVNDDPRITRTGKFLRRTSLDELPQFLNVLRGEMSLVGPRPALPSEVEEFPPGLRRRERMPQGITGLWQIDGRTDADFGKYTELDLRYVDEWSLRLDLSLVLRTPVVVLRQAWESCAIRQQGDTTTPAVLAIDPGGDVTIDLRDPAPDVDEVIIDLRDRAVDVIDLRDDVLDPVAATQRAEDRRQS